MNLSDYIIKINPNLTCSTNLTTISEIFDFISDQTSHKQKSDFCLKYQNYSIYFNKNPLTLPEIGFELMKPFTFVTGDPIRLFFSYDNFIITPDIDIYPFMRIYDVKCILAETFHTVTNNINFEKFTNEQNASAKDDDEIGQIKVNDKNPIKLKFKDGSSIYKVIFLMNPNFTIEYYYMYKTDNIYKLKSALAVYKSIPLTFLKIISDKPINDEDELRSITDNTLVINYVPLQPKLESVNITLSSGKEKLLISENLENTESYSIYTLIEKKIGINRKYFENYDTQNTNKTKIDIEIKTPLMLRLYYDENNCDILRLPIFSKVEDLRKIIPNFFRKKYNKRIKNFGIAINQRFVDNNSYIIKYTTFEYDKAIVVNVVLQEEKTEIYTFHHKGENEEIIQNYLIPKEPDISDLKKLIYPKNPASVQFTYDNKPIKSNFKLNNKHKSCKIIEYEIKTTKCQYQYNRSFNNLQKENGKIKDIFYDIEKNKTKEDKKKCYYYEAYSEEKIRFSFNDDINSLNFGAQEKKIIYISRKDKFNYSIYDVVSNKTKQYSEAKSIFNAQNKLSDIKDKLAKEFHYQDQEFLLFSDFALIEDNDIPLLCFPHTNNKTYVINKKEENKTLQFRGPIFTFTQKFNNNTDVPKYISRLFGLQTEDVTFKYKKDQNSYEFLPHYFSSSAFANETEIQIHFLSHKKLCNYKFKINSQKKSEAKKISFYDVKLDLYHIKLKVQKELNLLNYSPSIINLFFNEIQITEYGCFDNLSGECIIDVNKEYDPNNENLVTIKVDILGEIQDYNFLKDDKIETLKDMIRTEKDIKDNNSIKIFDLQGKEIKGDQPIKEQRQFKVTFSTINIICEGSLGNKTVEVIEFFNSEQAKNSISDQLKIDKNSFSLFIKWNNYYKDIGNVTRLPQQTIYAHKIIADTIISDIGTDQKTEIKQNNLSELCKLSYFILFGLSNLSDTYFSFSLSPDGKNEISEEHTFRDYLNSQKEKYIDLPNDNINHIYVFDKRNFKPDNTTTPQPTSNQLKISEVDSNTKNSNGTTNNQHKSKTKNSDATSNNQHKHKTKKSDVDSNQQKPKVKSNTASTNNQQELEATNTSTTTNNQQQQKISESNIMDNDNSNNQQNQRIQEVDTNQKISEVENNVEDGQSSNQKLNVSFNQIPMKVNETADNSNENDIENGIKYRFIDHLNDKKYEFKLPENSKIVDAKIKILEQSGQKNQIMIKSKIKLIDLIFGGKKLKDGLLMKALHMTDEEQIVVFMHDYTKIRIKSVYIPNKKPQLNLK
ncbi:hypothetical protein M9Y10_028363 [Tritrichomonas musculus]|uniref:Ubiquitin-like domain-containing protein n=1 Tax=Tritrichomonas musculus TaxID=1915356 RepID=A0ABR2KJ68_9EUKA